MSIAISILLAGLACLIFSVIRVLVRNIKAHEFFKTKSPKLPVVPNANIFSGHLYDVIINKKNWQIIDKLHEQHGPTFGYYCANQPWVSTKDLDLIKLIELDQPMRHINKAKFIDLVKELGDAFSSAECDDWRRRRRVMAPAFTNHKVRSKEVTQEFGETLKRLKDGIEHRMRDEHGKRSAILDAEDMFARFSLAAIFSIFYGRNDEIDFLADKDSYASGMNETNSAFQNPLLYMSIMFPFTVPILRLLFDYHKAGRIKNQICKYIVELTGVNRAAHVERDQVERQAGRADCAHVGASSNLEPADSVKRRLVDPIIDALLAKRVTCNEFVCDLYLLLYAGYQTTAETITCMAWHLAQHPHIQDKLRESITDKGAESEYLGWCIQETLRIHPAVPLGVGRLLGEDVTVNGLFLPKGTFVMPSSYSIHHDPNIWPEPEQFDPERWRDTSAHHRAAFMAFGLGPRNCVGGKFAVQEIKLVMRMLLTNYAIEKCPETVDKYAFSSPIMAFTYPDQPIKIRLVALDRNPCE